MEVSDFPANLWSLQQRPACIRTWYLCELKAAEEIVMRHIITLQGHTLQKSEENEV